MNRKLQSYIVVVAALALVSIFTSGYAYREVGGKLEKAAALYNEHRYRQAAEAYEEYLESSEKLGNLRDLEDEIRALRHLGECREKLGQYEEALTAQKKALALAVRINSKKQTTLCMLAAGRALSYLGEYLQAAKLIEKARYSRCKDLPEDHKARCDLEMAPVLGSLGRFDSMRRAAKRAHDYYYGVQNNRELARSLLYLGSCRQAVGEYDEALRMFKQALDVTGRSEQPDLAPVLFAMSSLYHGMGDYQKALENDRKALNIAVESGITEAVAVARERLGEDYMVFGEYDRALEEFQQALAMYRSMGAKDNIAASLLRTGRVRFLMEKETEAEEALMEADRLFAATGQPIGEAVCATALGELKKKQENLDEAKKQFSRALAIYRKAKEQNGMALATLSLAYLARDRDDMKSVLEHTRSVAGLSSDPTTLWQLRYLEGSALARLKKFSDAQQALTDSISILEDLRSRLETEALKSSFTGAGNKLGPYEEMIALLHRRGRHDEAFKYSERAKARSFLEQLGNRMLTLSSPQEQALLTREKTLSRRILQLSTRITQLKGGRHASEVRNLEQEMAAIEARHLAVVKQIRATSPELLSLVNVESTGAGHIRRQLGKNEVLLAYFVGENRVFSWVCTPDGITGRTASIPRKKLRHKVEFLRGLITSRAPQRAIRNMVKSLSKKLIKPVEDDIIGRKVYIVPHDVLHFLPFSLLTTTGKEHLLARSHIRYLPSSATLGFCRSKPKPTGETRALIMGNPDLDNTTWDLPFAQEEATFVSEAFNSDVFLRKEAMEKHLKDKVSGYHLVHLACHGILDPVLPLNSSLKLVPGGGEDGDLQVHEIYGLKLQSSLVVMSACQTALGKLTGGDEMVGLTRAFFYGGTPLIFSTLWSVSDVSTARLMQSFYRHLKTLPAEEALREAQLEIMQKFKHPFFWAPYILSGSS